VALAVLLCLGAAAGKHQEEAVQKSQELVERARSERELASVAVARQRAEEGKAEALMRKAETMTRKLAAMREKVAREESLRQTHENLRAKELDVERERVAAQKQWDKRAESRQRAVAWARSDLQRSLGGVGRPGRQSLAQEERGVEDHLKRVRDATDRYADRTGWGVEMLKRDEQDAASAGIHVVAGRGESGNGLGDLERGVRVVGREEARRRYRESIRCIKMLVARAYAEGERARGRAH